MSVFHERQVEVGAFKVVLQVDALHIIIGVVLRIKFGDDGKPEPFLDKSDRGPDGVHPDDVPEFQIIFLKKFIQHTRVFNENQSMVG